MFHKKNKDKIILFLSSYFPVYIIILIQNCGFLYNKIANNTNLNMFDILFTSEFLLILICMLLLVFSYCLVNIMLKRISQYSSNTMSVQVVKVENVNYQYVVTYFLVYIFPLIILNSYSISGILEFLILFFLIGYIYVKNNMIYVNPLINIFFHYNIHNVKMEYIDDDIKYDIETILFTKKDSVSLKNKNIEVIKQSEQFYIEP